MKSIEEQALDLLRAAVEWGKPEYTIPGQTFTVRGIPLDWIDAAEILLEKTNRG